MWSLLIIFFFFVGIFSILVGGMLLRFAPTRSPCGRSIGCCWLIPGALASSADGSMSIPGTRALDLISFEDTGPRWEVPWFFVERLRDTYFHFFVFVFFCFSGVFFNPLLASAGDLLWQGYCREEGPLGLW